MHINFTFPEDMCWALVGAADEDGDVIDPMLLSGWVANQVFGTDKATSMHGIRYVEKLSKELYRYDYSNGPIGYLWYGEAVLPPVMLVFETAPAQGGAAATLDLLAGLDGSVPGAVRGTPLDVPAASDVVRSDRVLAPARKGLFGKTPEAHEIRWAMRAGAQDILLTLGPVPTELVGRVVADAETLIRGLVVTPA